MKLKSLMLLTTLFSGLAVGSLAVAQEMDGGDVQREMRERQEKIGKLSTEEQLKLRAAQKKAAEDPTVKAAFDKRTEAIMAFRAAFRASMLQDDPTLQPILDKIAVGSKPGF